MRTEFETYTGEEAADLLEVVARIYATVYAEPPYLEGPADVDDFCCTWTKRVGSDGFRLVVARRRQAIGFAFGLYLPPDTDWWAGSLEPLGPIAVEWEHRTFALIELAVLRPHRRQGIGRALHARLLSGVSSERVTLLCRPEAEDAQATYAALGYHAIGRIRPGPGLPLYSAMIRPLRDQPGVG